MIVTVGLFRSGYRRDQPFRFALDVVKRSTALSQPLQFKPDILNL
jgi:hypothetical protein